MKARCEEKDISGYLKLNNSELTERHGPQPYQKFIFSWCSIASFTQLFILLNIILIDKVNNQMKLLLNTFVLVREL